MPDTRNILTQMHKLINEQILGIRKKLRGGSWEVAILKNKKLCWNVLINFRNIKQHLIYQKTLHNQITMLTVMANYKFLNFMV